MFLLYFYYTIQAKVIIMFAEMVIIVEHYEQKGNFRPKKNKYLVEFRLNDPRNTYPSRSYCA